MKTFLKIGYLTSVCCVAVSCSMLKPTSSVAQYNEFYYTNMDKIYMLEKGMSYDRVNDILGIKPHDIYVDYNNGKKILTYLYKNTYQEVASNELLNEVALSGGSPKYDPKEDHTLFCIFDENTNLLESYITDLGRKSGKDVLKDEKKLKSFVQNPKKPKAKVKIKKNSAKLGGGLGKFGLK